MFIPGTKITVICSSVYKKTGPRKGSIGFIGKQLDYIQPVTVDNYFKFFIYLFNIHFIRYGYEQTLRLETKPVYIAFPTPITYFTGKKQHITIGRILKKIKNEKEHILNKLYTQPSDINPNRDIVLCVPMFPTHVCDIIDSSDEEKTAWILSILNNLNMRELLINMKRPHPYIPQIIINQLYEAETNQEYRSKFIKDMFTSTSNNYARTLIKHIQILLLTRRNLEMKSGYKRLMVSYNDNVLSNNPENIRYIENDIIEYLFYPYFDDFIKEIQANKFHKTTGGFSVLNMIESIQLIKRRLLN